METISTLKDVKLTEKSLSGSYSNKLLGIIPIGTREFNFPLKQISSVRFSHEKNLIGLIISIIIALIAFSVGGGGIIVGIIFLIFAYLAFKGTVGIQIVTSGSDKEFILFSGKNNKTIKDFADKVNNAIADFT